MIFEFDSFNLINEFKRVYNESNIEQLDSIIALVINGITMIETIIFSRHKCLDPKKQI